MRLIDADAMLLRVDLIGTNKFGMLDEDIREFISEQPTVDIEHMLPFDWSKVPVDTPILVRDHESALWRKAHFAKYKNNKIYTFDNISNRSTKQLNKELNDTKQKESSD